MMRRKRSFPSIAVDGQPVRLDLQTSASRTIRRPFHGHITQITRDGSDGGFARYRLIVEPWLAFLGYTQDNYLFQDISVIDIVDELLSDWKEQGKLVPAWRWQLADPAAYPKRRISDSVGQHEWKKESPASSRACREGNAITP